MSTKSKEALNRMLEALIKGDTDDAVKAFHAASQIKSRTLILGEEKEDDDDDDKKSDDDDKKSDDDDDKKSDDDDDKKSDDDDDKKSDDDDDKKSDDDDDKKSDDDDDDDKKKKVDETLSAHPEGSFSRSIKGNTLKDKSPAGKEKISRGKDGVEKHGNSTKYLDDVIKGKIKPKRYPKGKKHPTHGNNAPGLAPDYKEDCDGRDYELGTGEV